MTNDIRKRAENILKANAGTLKSSWLSSERVIDMLATALQEPRLPMSEDEMLQRARRAASTRYYSGGAAGVMRGEADERPPVQTALTALRDLDKPVVDPIDDKISRLPGAGTFGSVVANSRAADMARMAYDMGVTDSAAR